MVSLMKRSLISRPSILGRTLSNCGTRVNPVGSNVDLLTGC